MTDTKNTKDTKDAKDNKDNKVKLTLKNMRVVAVWKYATENENCQLCHKDLMKPVQEISLTSTSNSIQSKLIQSNLIQSNLIQSNLIQSNSIPTNNKLNG